MYMYNFKPWRWVYKIKYVVLTMDYEYYLRLFDF